MFQRNGRKAAAAANPTNKESPGLDRAPGSERSSEAPDNADSCLARHADALSFRVGRTVHAACAERQNEEKRQHPHGNTLTPRPPDCAEIESPALIPPALSLALIPVVRS